MTDGTTSDGLAAAVGRVERYLAAHYRHAELLPSDVIAVHGTPPAELRGADLRTMLIALAVAGELTGELAGHGHGDFHYGDQDQDPRVVRLVLRWAALDDPTLIERVDVDHAIGRLHIDGWRIGRTRTSPYHPPELAGGRNPVTGLPFQITTDDDGLVAVAAKRFDPADYTVRKT